MSHRANLCIDRCLEVMSMFSTGLIFQHFTRQLSQNSLPRGAHSIAKAFKYTLDSRYNFPAGKCMSGALAALVPQCVGFSCLCDKWNSKIVFWFFPVETSAFQSSVGKIYPLNIDLNASLAVDGNTDSNIYDGSCMSTQQTEDNSWFAIDLGESKTILSVTITNMLATCSTYNRENFI